MSDEKQRRINFDGFRLTVISFPARLYRLLMIILNVLNPREDT
jgi:hypothetical protein